MIFIFVLELLHESISGEYRTVNSKNLVAHASTVMMTLCWNWGVEGRRGTGPRGSTDFNVVYYVRLKISNKCFNFI
jgi:hypothetical protein